MGSLAEYTVEAQANYTRKVYKMTFDVAALLLDASTEDSTAENILKAMQLFASLAASLGLPKLRCADFTPLRC
jgi:hypothetical protein